MFRRRRSFIGVLIRVLASIAIIAFTEGLLSQLLNDIIFVIIVPIAFVILAFAVSFLMTS